MNLIFCYSKLLFMKLIIYLNYYVTNKNELTWRMSTIIIRIKLIVFKFRYFSFRHRTSYLKHLDICINIIIYITLFETIVNHLSVFITTAQQEALMQSTLITHDMHQLLFRLVELNDYALLQNLKLYSTESINTFKNNVLI